MLHVFIDHDIGEKLNSMTQQLNGMNNNINGMNKNLNEMNSTINGRLYSLEDCVEQIKSTSGQCSNDSTGSFLDPAHNCSHILHDHPGSPSGNDIHTPIPALLLVSTVCRSLLATEQPWLCSEGVL